MTVEMISHLLEALMILCFGLSWPLSIYKSWTLASDFRQKKK